MYGNNFGYPFLGGPPISGNMISPMMQVPLRGASTGGLRSLLGLGNTTNGITNGGLNFTNLLNGASKTLGVVKDAIPVVKEVGPMMNNMRSMLKIASVFKDETDTSQRKEDTYSNNNVSTSNNQINNNQKTNNITNSNNQPNFFL